MKSDKVKASDQKLQSLGLKLRSRLQKEKIIIEAYNLSDQLQYSGEIALSQNIHFEDIKELLQQGQYKILDKNENVLKIKIGFMSLQLISKFSQNKSFEEFKSNIMAQIKRLKDQNVQQKNQLQKVKTELNLQIKQLKDQFGQQQKRHIEFTEELKRSYQQKLQNILITIKQSQSMDNNENNNKQKMVKKQQPKVDLTPLGYPISQIRWSLSLKSKQPQITDKIIGSQYKSSTWLVCLQIGFPSTLKKKQVWAIKINNNQKKDVRIDRIYIRLGICLRNVINKTYFKNSLWNQEIQWGKLGHGCYAIGSDGMLHSHSVEQFNNVQKGFQINLNDIVYVEYDPIRLCLKFGRNENGLRIQMPITLPPQGDFYHPFVYFQQKYQGGSYTFYDRSYSPQIELVLPGRLL